MVLQRLSALLGSVLVLLPALAAGQTPLSLDEAVAQAVARNPTLAAARAAGRQADAETRVAQSSRLPQIQFSEAWQRSTQPVAGFGTLLNARRFTAADFAIDRLNRPGAVDGFSRQLGVSQMLFDGGHTHASVTIAKRKADVAVAQVTAIAADLAFQVARAYGRVLAETSVVEAAQAALAAAREDHARALARRDAGTVTDADALALAVHAATVEQQLLQAQSELVVACASLNQLRSAPLDELFLVVRPAAPDSPASLDALVVEALRARPEVIQADLAVAIAEAGLRDARGGWWPSVVAGAGYEWDGLSFGARESAWTISAALRWNISVGGAEAARVSGARAALDRATAARESARSSITLDVLAARQQCLVAESRKTAGALSVEQAAESLRITRQRYDAGLATVRDVLAASAAHLAATTQRTANDIDVVIAWAALQRTLGRSPILVPAAK